LPTAEGKDRSTLHLHGALAWHGMARQGLLGCQETPRKLEGDDVDVNGGAQAQGVVSTR
tara:strand:+ start:547 stop:723 length:177 start_codon:yes stop_codon:yes gene_type:complete